MTFYNNSFLESNYLLLDALSLSSNSPTIFCRSPVDIGKSWADKFKFVTGLIASNGLTNKLHSTLVKRGRIKLGWKSFS